MEEIYLSGKELYGDKFTSEQIEKWYNEEKEGYADLGAKNSNGSNYGYHSLNKRLGFRYVLKSNKNCHFENVLGIGSAYSAEFLPIINKISNLTILEPSDNLIEQKIDNINLQYIKPNSSGIMPFDNCSFNFISCLGTLHHIPNVTTVVNEIFRVLKKDGIAIIREPIVSMGDWEKQRAGLTKNERGIPKKILQKIIVDAGFKIIKKSYCITPFTRLIGKTLKISPWNNDFLVFLDSIFSFLFRWNYHYHPKNNFEKLQPQSVYFVLTK